VNSRPLKTPPQKKSAVQASNRDVEQSLDKKYDINKHYIK
jgi:hypothetical protein